MSVSFVRLQLLFVSVCCVYILSGLLLLWGLFFNFLHSTCLPFSCQHYSRRNFCIFASTFSTTPFCFVLSGLLTSVLLVSPLATFRALCLYFFASASPLSAFFTLAFFTLAFFLATRSDENEQNCSQVNTKLFRLSLDLPHKHEDTPVVRSDGKNTMLLFCYWTNCIV